MVDGLASLVHGTPDLSAGPPDYVGVATAVAAQGRLSDAIGAGIEIADQVTKTTGQNTLFMVNSTGLYGGVAWITPSANISEVDAGETALDGRPGVAQADRPCRYGLRARRGASHLSPYRLNPSATEPVRAGW